VTNTRNNVITLARLSESWIWKESKADRGTKSNADPRALPFNLTVSGDQYVNNLRLHNRSACSNSCKEVI